MLQMIDTVETVRATDNPYLRILGVVPTMYDRSWPDHQAYLVQMQEACVERRLCLFPPVHRRHSYLSLSTAGQDYRPIANAVSEAIAQRAAAYA